MAVLESVVVISCKGNAAIAHVCLLGENRRKGSGPHAHLFTSNCTTVGLLRHVHKAP